MGDGVKPVDLAAVEQLVETTDAVVREALAVAGRRTDGGKNIDDEQVHCERLAYAATEVAAARAFVAYAKASGAVQADVALDAMAGLFSAEVAQRLAAQVDAHIDEFGISAERLNATLGAAPAKKLIRAVTADTAVCAIGRHVAQQRGVNHAWIDDELAVMTRDSVRQFAESEVAPIAEHIHRTDDLVPDAIIDKMSELGFFGMSVPEEFGGGGMGNLAMIITTEELSRCSLAAAGSLITRPEILTKALLKGGTDAQKQKWLPPIAAGKIMAGISVTEPDTGSDVASVKCRADAAEVGGRKGYVLNGAKAWCTFAGRANVLALLARTDPNFKKGARGLSLFIVEKDVFRGHSFEMKQPGGGQLTGKADATPGYRGMHSFTLALDNYFVPAENLVGEQGGINKGFYLQMNGFAAGRLQTGGRATGSVAGGARAHRRVRQRPQAVRPADRFVPTDPTQARAHGDQHHGGPAADLRGAGDGPRRVDRARAGDGQAVRLRRRRLGDTGGSAGARRLGLCRGVPDLALRHRRASAADLRRRQTDPRAQGHRPRAAGRVSEPTV